ncbi:hypothetical protein BLA29_010719 [Euroglyphus maynei]|uniref:Uncharacterized protein n=1 Tax=Euroglyphus maynei TaxID=6958 RepID=A0A1Y3BN90_EURMA|nr:hypothetical protein BLA29_010719 [Euroglyphus maynei]
MEVYDSVIKCESFDNDDDDDMSKNNWNDQYEMKVADQQRQIDLISRKLLYMEEHIIDLNNENSTLRKQLQQNEELFRKKIQLREDEIETLQENIVEMETMNAELRCKEHELSMQKRIQQEDIKLLKQQVSLIRTHLIS